MKTKIIEIEINDYSDYTTEQLEDKVKTLVLDMITGGEPTTADETMKLIKLMLELKDLEEITASKSRGAVC